MKSSHYHQKDTKTHLTKMHKNLNEGHRLRLKNKFLKADIGALYNYEMLELLLFYSIPRKDVKPIAK